MRILSPHRNTFLAPVAVIVLFASVMTGCMKEDNDGLGREREPVNITLAPFTRASDAITDPGTVSDPDEIVSEFRVMAFGSADGLLCLNEYFDFTANFSNPIELQFFTGTYDIVFIANEKSDNSLHLLLDAMDDTSTLTQLSGLAFSSTAFDAARNIPMASVYWDIEIDVLQGLSEDGGTTFIAADTLTPWEVEIERLGVRLDIMLRTSWATMASDYRSLGLDRVPDRVYILEKNKNGSAIYNSGSYQAATSIALSAGDTGYTSAMILNSAAEAYEWKKTRVILPSSTFAAGTDKDYGVKMTVNYSTYDPQTSVLGPVVNTADNVDHGYNLPRNHYIALTGSLSPQLNIRLNVQQWKKGLEVDYPIGSVYRLLLSDTSLSIPYNALDTILEIWTDYPDGWSALISSEALTVVPYANDPVTLSHMQGPTGTTTVTVAKPPDGTQGATAYIHITAGNMTAVVSVSIVYQAGN